MNSFCCSAYTKIMFRNSILSSIYRFDQVIKLISQILIFTNLIFRLVFQMAFGILSDIPFFPFWRFWVGQSFKEMKNNQFGSLTILGEATPMKFSYTTLDGRIKSDKTSKNGNGFVSQLVSSLIDLLYGNLLYLECPFLTLS